MQPCPYSLPLLDRSATLFSPLCAPPGKPCLGFLGDPLMFLFSFFSRFVRFVEAFQHPSQFGAFFCLLGLAFYLPTMSDQLGDRTENQALLHFALQLPLLK